MLNIQTQINQLESYLEYLHSQVNLTSSNVIIHNIPSWGLCMRGTIRTKEKCPKCNKLFENVNNKLLICKEHFEIPLHFYIDLYWNGKQRKIYSDNDGQVLNNFEIANRVLTEIRQRIKKHSFDPADYMAKRYIDMRFIDYIEKWINRYQEMYKKKEKSKSTWMKKKYYTDKYFIPFFTKYDIRDIRTGNIDDFYFSLPNRLSLQSKKNIMCILRTLFIYAKRRKDIKEVPDFPEINLPEKKIEWIDEDIQEKIYYNLSENYKPIFLFMFRQGVRPGEARALRYEDIDRKNKTVTIQRTFSENECKDYTKTKNIRILPLDDDVYEMIIKNNAISGYVFTHSKGNKPFFSNEALHYAWKKALKKAELKHIKIYDATRHSFASQALNRGAPLDLIQYFLGHTTQIMTKRYSHIDTKGLKLVLKKAKILKMKKEK